MQIGHELNTKYYMTEDTNEVEMQSVNEEKDLGVFLTSDLKSSRQCIKSAARVRSILGLIRRQFRRLDKDGFLLVYKTYVRPHIEYCIQAWSPHLNKDIHCLEAVQRAATKLVPHFAN